MRGLAVEVVAGEPSRPRHGGVPFPVEGASSSVAGIGREREDSRRCWGKKAVVTQRRGDAARGDCETVKGLHCERGAAAIE